MWPGQAVDRGVECEQREARYSWVSLQIDFSTWRVYTGWGSKERNGCRC